MSKEPSQPKKSIFDHPDFEHTSREMKVGYTSSLIGMKDLVWDGKFLLVPTNPTNLSKMNRWLELCEQEKLSLRDVTAEMDPNSANPMYKYFLLEDE